MVTVVSVADLNPYQYTHNTSATGDNRSATGDNTSATGDNTSATGDR